MTNNNSREFPPVSLIISSRNRHKLLRETVQSVLEGSALPAEIILVDQSDQPEPSLAALGDQSGCEVRYHPVEFNGLSRGKNRGIQLARNEVIAFIDDDMFVARDWFETLIQSLLRAGPMTVVTGRVLPSVEKGVEGYVPAVVVRETPALFQGRIHRDVLAGGHMAAYRSVFEQVGCFDERLGAGSTFPAAEDNEWGFRVLEAGYTIVYVPEAVLYHRAWRPLDDQLSIQWCYGRGQGGYYAKYLSLQDRHMLRRLVKDILYRLRRFPVRIILDRRAAERDLVFITGILVGAARWLLTQTKKDSQETTTH